MFEPSPIWPDFTFCQLFLWFWQIMTRYDFLETRWVILSNVWTDYWYCFFLCGQKATYIWRRYQADRPLVFLWHGVSLGSWQCTENIWICLNRPKVILKAGTVKFGSFFTWGQFCHKLFHNLFSILARSLPMRVLMDCQEMDLIEWHFYRSKWRWIWFSYSICPLHKKKKNRYGGLHFCTIAYFQSKLRMGNICIPSKSTMPFIPVCIGWHVHVVWAS